MMTEGEAASSEVLNEDNNAGDYNGSTRAGVMVERVCRVNIVEMAAEAGVMWECNDNEGVDF